MVCWHDQGIGLPAPRSVAQARHRLELNADRKNRDMEASITTQKTRPNDQVSVRWNPLRLKEARVGEYVVTTANSGGVRTLTTVFVQRWRHGYRGAKCKCSGSYDQYWEYRSFMRSNAFSDRGLTIQSNGNGRLHATKQNR